MARFKRIKKIAEDLNNSISTLSDDELRKLIRECKKLSTTNCWFLLYDIRDIVVERSKAILELRRKKRGDD